MSKPVDDMLQSILDEFAVSKQSHDELVARALFRLLNYCPPPAASVQQLPDGGSGPPRRGLGGRF
jgi:hypothetical protein